MPWGHHRADAWSSWSHRKPQVAAGAGTAHAPAPVRSRSASTPARPTRPPDAGPRGRRPRRPGRRCAAGAARGVAPCAQCAADRGGLRRLPARAPGRRRRRASATAGCWRRGAPTRPRPPGRWELPGGKVEPGEDPEAAVVREVVEELGCRVEVIGRARRRAGGRGRLHRCGCCWPSSSTASPCPHEHDVLRWLGPEELDEVDWLDPDRPFLAELRELLLDGRAAARAATWAEPCGSAGPCGVPTGAWTPAVHRLLHHLRAAGLPGRARGARHSTPGAARCSTYLPGRGASTSTASC